MKFIIKANQLTNKFIELSEIYTNIAFATAWASSQHIAFQELLEKHQHKIQFSVIGLHFYQTDPRVLWDFENHHNIKFMKQTNGVFHPKIYVFWNDETDWAILMGSANFTNAAFNGKNIESTILISSDDSETKFFSQIIDFLKDCFNDASYLTSEEIKNYQQLYRFRQKEQNALSNQYNNKNMEKSILNVDILNYSWHEYFNIIQKDIHHGFTERLEILAFTHELFLNNDDFSKMDLPNRQFIAGTGRGKSGWFGSMIGNGQFKNAINENSSMLAQAINQIPLFGAVSEQAFFDYIEIYQSTPQFSDKPNSLGTATRLLSMKRPDLFICFNNKNRHKICDDLGIKKSNMTAERYWFEVLQRFYDTAWFNSEEPQNEEEKCAWCGRMALLDCVYYQE